jgi:hypothetical protein
MRCPTFHFFSLYAWELNFRQTILDKTKVLLRTSWGTYLGIREKNKKPLPHHSKRKKLESAC